MVKDEPHPSIPWETAHQQQLNYYMNIPENYYTTCTENSPTLQTVPSLTFDKNSSSPSNEFSSTITPDHKEVYPWMNDKKIGNNKTKNNSKIHITTSASSGKIPFSDQI
jgi:hypothetical protein